MTISGRSSEVPREAKRALLSPAFVRMMLAGHSALGLAFALLIYVVCLTGTITVFMFEIQRWEQPDAPVVAEPVDRSTIERALASLYAEAVRKGGAHQLTLHAPSALSPRFLGSYSGEHKDGGEEIEATWILDGEGRLAVEAAAPLADFIATLHARLHLPATFGLFIVGLTGVTLLSSLISGLLSHPRLFKDAFHLRLHRSMRLGLADLHNRLSVWALPFHLAVSTTGALIGLSQLIIGILALAAYDGDRQKAMSELFGPAATEDETQAAIPDIGRMIEQLSGESSEARVERILIQHVGTRGQVVQIGISHPGHLAFSNIYTFDGGGTLVWDGGAEAGSIGQQILGAIPPLHFGWFGGMWVKMAYGCLGAALTIVTWSGVAIWLNRKRDRGQPSPALEAVWASVTWGVPAVLALTAVVAALGGQEADLLKAFGVATVAIAVLAAFLGKARRVSVALRIISAVGLASTVLIHAIDRCGQFNDQMALGVGAVLLALAAGLCLGVLKRPLSSSKN